MMNLKIEGLPFVLNYLHNPQIESYIFPVLQQTSAFSSRVFNSGGASSICKKKKGELRNLQCCIIVTFFKKQTSPKQIGSVV